MNRRPVINSSTARVADPVRMVVIATYNERENISSLIFAILKTQPEFRVLVVDDNSPDGTGEIVAGLAAEDDRVNLLTRPGKLGYGTAIRDGFREAVRLGGDRVFTMDADHSHDPRDLAGLDRALETNDLVIGSRYLGGIRVLNWSPGRLALSLGANAYARRLLRLRYADCTSGFRGYGPRAAGRLFREPIISSGYAFLVEVLYAARRAGLSIAEIPIIYTERRAGQSKMSRAGIWEAAWRPWLLLIRELMKKVNRQRS
jgi:dolichol-phosphate mannosyltransferase